LVAVATVVLVSAGAVVSVVLDPAAFVVSVVLASDSVVAVVLVSATEPSVVEEAEATGLSFLLARVATRTTATTRARVMAERLAITSLVVASCRFHHPGPCF
jgi:hypothetical protein